MTESDYINELRIRWPQNSDAALETLALADEAVQIFPRSAQLWCIRGDLIQLGPASCPHSLDDARASYERAIEIDPQFIEALESLGHFHNAVMDDEATARRYFTETERLRKIWN